MNFNQLVLEEINPFEPNYTVLRMATKEDKDILIKGLKYSTDKKHKQQIYDTKYFVVEDQEGTIMAVHWNTSNETFYIRNLNKPNKPFIGSKTVNVKSIEGVDLLKAIKHFELVNGLKDGAREDWKDILS